MSFLKSLFGGSKTPAGPAAREEYKGYLIEAVPFQEGSQFQLSGIIRKDVDGTPREHRFIRADRFASIEDAASFTLVKGRQIVDQMGDRMFG